MGNVTTRFKLVLPALDKIPWNADINNNMHVIDALMARFLAISNIQGVYQKATKVTVAQRYIDTADDTIWEVLIAHTTPSTGTFAAHRLATPGNWQDITPDATSAIAAATSEANAASSASAASTSEANAATSANEAAAAVLRFTFDTSITMADPGVGDFRLNNGAIASVTAIAFDAQSADAGTPDFSDFIATWGASTDAIKGQIILRDLAAPANFAVFNVTATVTDNTGWLQVTVVHVDSNGTFGSADVISVSFSRTGAVGAAGTADGTLFTGDATAAVAATVNSSVDSIAIGDGAAIGAVSPRSVAMGALASVAAGVTGGIAVGDAATVEANGAIAVGDAAVTNNSVDAVAIGPTATVAAGGTDAVAVGKSAGVTDSSPGAVAIGFISLVRADRGIGIGRAATVNTTASDSIAIGAASVVAAAAIDAIAIGNAATVNNLEGIAIGDGAQCDGDSAIAIGKNSGMAASSSNAIVVGEGATGRDAGDITFNVTADVNYQGHTLQPWLSTSNATPTALNMGPGTNAGFAIAAETTYGFKGIIVARTVADLSAMWEVKGMISRTSATTTLLFNTVVKLHDATAGVTLAVAANDTNDTLEFTATGIAATVIRWAGKIEVTEVVH